MKKKHYTPKQARPSRLLISIEEHIVNALMLYLRKAKAPKAVLDLFDNLVTLYAWKHHSSPEANRQLQDALLNAMRNMDAINAPVHGPYGEIEQ
jgi:hypothetical protein